MVTGRHENSCNNLRSEGEDKCYSSLPDNVTMLTIEWVMRGSITGLTEVYALPALWQKNNEIR